MARYDTDRETLQRQAKLDTFRGSGPGGQHRNKTESAVRLFHPQSGVTVVAADSRSQARNRELAFERLQGRLIALNRKPKPRIRTKRSRSAVERRLKDKRLRSRKKALRARAGRGQNE